MSDLYNTPPEGVNNIVASASEPVNLTSPMEKVRLYGEAFGYQPEIGDIDPRPLPDFEEAAKAVEDAFESLGHAFADTAMAPYLSDVMGGFVNAFTRLNAHPFGRIAKALDLNEVEQNRLRDEQDGSEINSVELERALEKGEKLVEIARFCDALGEHAADLYAQHTGNPWRARPSRIGERKAFTAAVIQSRDFISAQKAERVTRFIPKGVRVALVGGDRDFPSNEAASAWINRLWTALDSIRAKCADEGMVLFTPGYTKDDHNAMDWAKARGVSIVHFELFKKDGKRAGYLRNDRLLEQTPRMIIALNGPAATANLIAKALLDGTQVFDFENRTAVAMREGDLIGFEHAPDFQDLVLRHVSDVRRHGGTRLGRDKTKT